MCAQKHEEETVMGRKISGRLEWIDHRGTDILLVNLCDLEGIEYAEELRAACDLLVEIGQKGNGDLLLLLRLFRTKPTTEVLNVYRLGGKDIEPYVRAQAVVGISGLRKHMLNFLKVGLKFSTRLFDTEEQAKDWLIGQQ
jgi:hypothetical protein